MTSISTSPLSSTLTVIASPTFTTVATSASSAPVASRSTTGAISKSASTTSTTSAATARACEAGRYMLSTKQVVYDSFSSGTFDLTLKAAGGAKYTEYMVDCLDYCDSLGSACQSVVWNTAGTTESFCYPRAGLPVPLVGTSQSFVSYSAIKNTTVKSCMGQGTDLQSLVVEPVTGDFHLKLVAIGGTSPVNGYYLTFNQTSQPAANSTQANYIRAVVNPPLSAFRITNPSSRAPLTQMISTSTGVQAVAAGVVRTTTANRPPTLSVFNQLDVTYPLLFGYSAIHNTLIATDSSGSAVNFVTCGSSTILQVTYAGTAPSGCTLCSLNVELV
ncbi:hypothetical protein ANO11243_075820 [Dothideomycetidae sp. 11243]|nr:hypothetical protein ANO11243_075820 [fungal sp. No.11243]